MQSYERPTWRGVARIALSNAQLRIWLICSFIVRDNGTGTRQPAREQSGIGLSNTTARLKELYGNRARLTLASASDAGFAAEIVLPYRSSAPPTSVPTKATS